MSDAGAGLLMRAMTVLRGVPTITVLVLFLLLALTVDPFNAPSWHDSHRLLQLLALLLIAVPGLRASAADADWRLSFSWSWAWMPASAFALGLVSVLLSAWPRWALLEWAMTMVLLMVAAVVAAEFRRDPVALRRLTVVIFYTAGLFYALKSLLAYVLMFSIGTDYGLAFDVQELFPGFSNVRFFGHVQTLLLPFLVLPALWWGKSSGQRALWMLVPVAWWMLAIASGTRGSWVAMTIGVITACLFARGAATSWLKLQLLGFIAGLLMYVLFVLGLPELLSKPALYLHRGADLVSLRGRELLWGLSVDWISVHPWFGLGPMHFAQRLTEIAAHPHNAVLQWMVEWGIPAALLLTVFFAVAGLRFAAWVRIHRPPDTAAATVSVALLAALTGAAAQAMVDGVLVMPISQLLLVLLAGWAWSLVAPRPAVAPGRSIAFRYLFSALVAVVLLCVAPEVPHLQERLEAHEKVYPQGPNPRLLPRFWIHGWIPD